ncbi:MAG: hypothetical protein GF320_22375 [Armatimonadia bacterium]|nr:hypothetical protein [Armatimonadia bacterium]
MTTRQQFLRALSDTDAKPPVMEWMGWWPETVEAWTGKGLPEGADPYEHFGLSRPHYIPVAFNPRPPFEVRILEEDADTRTVVDPTGVIKKEFKHGSAMPHYIEFPIRDRPTYEAYVERLDPDDHGRYPPNWPQMVEAWKTRDYPLGMIIRGPFAFGRDFVDFAELMMLYMDDTALMREISENHAEFTERLWTRAVTEVEVDYVVLGEDMAYKNGPMISPAQVREFCAPFYQRISGFLKRHGVGVIIVDSDGDMRPLLEIFLDSGITGVLPLEANAGVTPSEILRIADGRPVQMIGGIDKTKLAAGREAIDAELDAKLPLIERAAWIPSVDHSVPPDVSYDDYRYYLDALSDRLQ